MSGASTSDVGRCNMPPEDAEDGRTYCDEPAVFESRERVYVYGAPRGVLVPFRWCLGHLRRHASRFAFDPLEGDAG